MHFRIISHNARSYLVGRDDRRINRAVDSFDLVACCLSVVHLLRVQIRFVVLWGGLLVAAALGQVHR